MTVRELLARIDSRELSEWMAYEQISGPLGGYRIDLAAATIATTVANSNRGRRKPFRFEEFLPEWSKPLKRVMSPEQMWDQVQAMHARMSRLGRRKQ